MHGVRRRVGWFLAALAIATLVPRTAFAQQPARTDRATAPPPDSGLLDCTSCHPSVHATMLRAGPQGSTRCSTCHEGVHGAIQALFTGRGADTTVRPDRMYLARIGCRGCHSDATMAAKAGAPRAAAIGAACLSCHGPAYAKILPRWTEGLAWRRKAVDAYVAAANADARLTGRDDTRAALQSASADLALVTKGDALHNVPAADALLRSALRKAGGAYRAAGLPAPHAPALGPDPNAESCAYCHYGIEAVGDTALGQPFNHAGHVIRADVACSRCHSNADYFTTAGRRLDPAHGKTTVTAAACSACHHVATALACAACHRSPDLAGHADSVKLPLHLTPAGAPASRTVAFRHAAHAALACTRCHMSGAAIATVPACASCHETHHQDAGDCAACHGTTLLASHKAADHLACAACHARGTLALLTGDRTFCLGCHLDRRAHHPSQECAPCHLQMSPNEVRDRILGRRP